VSCDAALVAAAGPGLLTVNDPVPWLCKSAALKTTCNTVGLTTVVGRADPFHIATEFASNPVPVMVIVAALPGATYRGAIEAITGVGLFTVNVTAADVPPPGAGFCAVTALAELPARSAAGTVAFTSVPLTKVVKSAVPFHATTVEAINPDPLTSSEVSPVPATTAAGLIFAMAGAGFEAGGGGVVVEAVPPAPPQPEISTIPKMRIGKTCVGRVRFIPRSINRQAFGLS
jgi:hypothetical protein